MEQTAHIFTPQDDSLSERIRAYLRVSVDMSQFNDRKKQYGNSDILGDKEDVAMAYQILQNSFSEAYKHITDKDVVKAQNEGLMTADEVRSFFQGKRAREIQHQREHSEQLSNSHTLKR